MNAIDWSLKAVKQLRKLNMHDQRSIRDAVDQLAAMPSCQNVKVLIDHEYRYRLRVGNYRVLFDWSSDVKIVEIQEVKRRNEGTY